LEVRALQQHRAVHTSQIARWPSQSCWPIQSQCYARLCGIIQAARAAH
jgi:hypothetical protein